MYGALMRRADTLAGCTEGSTEEAELKAIFDLIEAYEAKRRPLLSAGARPLTRDKMSIPDPLRCCSCPLQKIAQEGF